MTLIASDAAVTPSRHVTKREWADIIAALLNMHCDTYNGIFKALESAGVLSWNDIDFSPPLPTVKH
jgi:hypothetical protein